MNQEQSNQNKEVAFYSACVNAWIKNRMQLDKSMLNLSALSLFLLAIINIFEKLSHQSLVFCYFSIGFFSVCIIAVISIFIRNKTYLEQVIKDKRTDKDKILSVLDNTAKYSFLAGYINFILMGLFSL